MERTLRILPLLVLPLTVQAQIPNGGFENWTEDSGILEPTGWTTVNALGGLLGLSFAEQTPGAVGTYGIALTTQEVPGLGIIPSVAFVGDLGSETEGFAYTGRPTALTGQFKFIPEGEDLGTVAVTFWRWDAGAGERVDIGAGFLALSEAATSWTGFEIPIEYTSSETPDSANVTLLSSVGSPTAGGTQLSIDALAFTNTTNVVSRAIDELAIYPNPTNDRIWIEQNGGTLLRAEVWSADGRLLLTQGITTAPTVLDVSTLPAGNYHLQAITVDGDIVRSRFMKN